ncbi:hypothetical protein [Streptomyces parvus]|uniref:hypothetical protein n=1 Tax=Streptomyces parvus TaxID=66428 RepID=UPI0021013D74|nr:hypothetical protein [Streptomyces parvus]MCQ1582412.1 hypothetical protein [Streptomyces parvus]
MPVLTAPPATARPDLAPTGNRGPVEQAVVQDALAAAGPETLVRTDVPLPDGSVRLYAAWTDGGGPLADHIDRVALARGLDAWSWVEILTHSARTTHRGRIEVRTHPLRQVLADVERGHRGNEAYRAGFARMLADDAERAGRPPLPAPGIPAWPGVGPLLWHRYAGDDMVVERHWLGG